MRISWDDPNVNHQLTKADIKSWLRSLQLKPVERSILRAIVSLGKKGRARAFFSGIADIAGVSERTISRHLPKLSEKGALAYELQQGGHFFWYPAVLTVARMEAAR